MKKNGKTIRQIAEDLGVSKTAVRKKITDEIRNQFAETIGNVIYISEQGETLIKSGFSKDTGNPVSANVSANQTETVSALVFALQNELEAKNKQLEVKDKQLDVKDKQLDDLNARLADTTAALVSAQKLAQTAQALHAGTIQQQLITDGDDPKDKPGFRERLKYLFKGK